MRYCMFHIHNSGFRMCVWRGVGRLRLICYTHKFLYTTTEMDYKSCNFPRDIAQKQVAFQTIQPGIKHLKFKRAITPIKISSRRGSSS